MILGFIEFALLSASVLFAAVSVGVRAKWTDRAELFVGVFVISHALITFPTLALGWLNLLSRPMLAGAVATAALATFVLASWGIPLSRHLRATSNAAAGLCRLPWDALVMAFRARHIAFVGMAMTLAVLIYVTWLSYLAPSTGWDGHWYHETIVGYAIQNRGFRFVDIPASLDYVNSFPRVCEMMNLWFVIFSDRRFIDMVNAAVSPAIIAAFYVMAHRYEPSKLRAATWAIAFFWLPGLILQLNSNYIDTHIASIHLATLAFATRPKLRLRDGIVAGLAFGLLSGTKGHALSWIPFSGAVAIGRLFWQNFRTRKLPTLGVAAIAVACIAFVAAPTYVRNWIRFKNPIFPIEVSVESLNIHFPGHQRLSDIRRPFMRVLTDSYAIHTPGADHVDIGGLGYGYAIPWIALPLAALAIVVAIGKSIVGRLSFAHTEDSDNLLLTTLPVLISAPLSPALWSARYNLHVAAGVMLLAAWATSRRGLRLFGDGPVAICLVTSMTFLYWAKPGWSVTLEDAQRMSPLPPVERASFEWTGNWAMHDFAWHRETDLRPHDVVVYTDAYLFPGLLWNERYENEIAYVHWTGSQEFLRDLDAARAKWVTLFVGSPGYADLLASGEWQEMGPITKNTEHWHWFRRQPKQAVP